MGQTVNLLVYAYGGSNPSAPTQKTSGSSSFGRAIAFQAIGGGFEPRLPLGIPSSLCSSVVEHFLGKEEVGSSILLKGSFGFLKAAGIYRTPKTFRVHFLLIPVRFLIF